jgi:hypothetical protein
MNRPQKLILFVLTAIMLPGCSMSVRSQPRDGQTGIDGDRALLEKKDGVAVLARYVRAPWDYGERHTAFRLVISNYRDQTIRLADEGLVLVSEDGLRRRPLDPERLESSFRQAALNTDVSPSLRFAVAASYPPPRWPHRHYRRHYRRYHRYDYYYDYPPRFYWSYGWGPYYDFYYDYDLYAVQRDRERIARFLAEMYRGESIMPQEEFAGAVVFNYAPQEEEVFTLRVSFEPDAAEAPATQRAPAQSDVEEGPIAFEFDFFRKR